MIRFSGIVHITGEHDTGKTLMAIGACDPSKIAFFHNDTKRPLTDRTDEEHNEIFGLYDNLIDKNLTYLETKDYFLEQLDKMKPGQYEGIVVDTWTRLEDALINYGKINAYKFREKTTMAAGQTYLWGQQWAEGRWYEASIISKMAKLAPYVCLVTHLKGHYLSGAKTGKEIPASSEVLDRVCNLRVWLRSNPNSGVPVALVLKRPSLSKVSTSGIEIINYLPRRLEPLPGEKSVWDTIDRYKENPVGNHPPSEKEKPTPFELSILDGILTNDQKEVWKANLLEQERKEEIEETLSNEQYEDFKKLVLENRDKGLGAISQLVGQKGFDYDLGQIQLILNGVGS